jgi:hypothetical protein
MASVLADAAGLVIFSAVTRSAGFDPWAWAGPIAAVANRPLNRIPRNVFVIGVLPF